VGVLTNPVQPSLYIIFARNSHSHDQSNPSVITASSLTPHNKPERIHCIAVPTPPCNEFRMTCNESSISTFLTDFATPKKLVIGLSPELALSVTPSHSPTLHSIRHRLATPSERFKNCGSDLSENLIASRSMGPTIGWGDRCHHATHAQRAALLLDLCRLDPSLRRTTMKTSLPQKPADAEKQLKGFISKFEPKHQSLIRAVRKALRKRFPTANEFAYDNYNFFVIGYGPTERPSDCIISMAAGANGVGLCFIRGARLPDPNKILLGSGKQTRFVRIESVDVLARPAVEAILAAAVAQSKTPLPASGRGKLSIRSVSAKQRPRRRPAK
jgi:hypothetical protein